MTDEQSPSPDPQLLRGLPGAPGLAVAPALVVGKQATVLGRKTIDDDDVDTESQRFLNAVTQARKDLRDVMGRAAHLGSELTILDAYLLMLDDPQLGDAALQAIHDQRQCAEWAVSSTTHQMAARMLSSEDTYLRERGHDVQFVGELVLRALRGDVSFRHFTQPEQKVVVVAHDLSPADTAAMAHALVAGIVTEVGTATSHTAIMARALDIPAVVGCTGALSRIASGDLVVVDGRRAEVIVHPSARDLQEVHGRELRRAEVSARLHHAAPGPSTTACGCEIRLQANVELPEEAKLAAQHGARGIGLYRTEFLYVDRTDLPGEQEQYEKYCEVIDAVAPHPVTLRTFDIGGDKFLSSFDVPTDMNPALGLRAIRLALANPELFLVQLRAMIRASRSGNTRIMIPMIATLREYRETRAILEVACEQVGMRGWPVPLGVMIEVPSAALLADRFAREVDFMSLGTNDLVQYTLAADRTSRALAYLASALDPSVLKLIDNVVTAARTHSKPVSICGQLASDPLGAVLLVGLGLRDLSMEPAAVPEIKEVLHRITVAEAQAVAKQALLAESAQEVEDLLRVHFSSRLADILGITL